MHRQQQQQQQQYQWCCELKIRGAGSCNFHTDSCKFLKEEITGTQNFNFALKVFQNGGFSAPNFAF